MYITARILERSVYIKIWTQSTVLTLLLVGSIYFPSSLLLCTVQPKKIIGVFIIVVIVSHHVKYLHTVNVKKISGKDEVNGRSPW